MLQRIARLVSCLLALTSPTVRVQAAPQGTESGWVRTASGLELILTRR